MSTDTTNHSTGETLRPLYSRRDTEELGGFYFTHVTAMTSEGLHSKSDIAAELAWRDQQLAHNNKELAREMAQRDAACKDREAAETELAAAKRRESALREALTAFASAIDMDHLEAVWQARVNLSGDAVRDIKSALQQASQALLNPNESERKTS